MSSLVLALVLKGFLSTEWCEVTPPLTGAQVRGFVTALRSKNETARACALTNLTALSRLDEDEPFPTPGTEAEQDLVRAELRVLLWAALREGTLAPEAVHDESLTASFTLLDRDAPDPKLIAEIRATLASPSQAVVDVACTLISPLALRLAPLAPDLLALARKPPVRSGVLEALVAVGLEEPSTWELLFEGARSEDEAIRIPMLRLLSRAPEAFTEARTAVIHRAIVQHCEVVALNAAVDSRVPDTRLLQALLDSARRCEGHPHDRIRGLEAAFTLFPDAPAVQTMLGEAATADRWPWLREIALITLANDRRTGTPAWLAVRAHRGFSEKDLYSLFRDFRVGEAESDSAARVLMTAADPALRRSARAWLARSISEARTENELLLRAGLSYEGAFQACRTETRFSLTVGVDATGTVTTLRLNPANHPAAACVRQALQGHGFEVRGAVSVTLPWVVARPTRLTPDASVETIEARLRFIEAYLRHDPERFGFQLADLVRLKAQVRDEKLRQRVLEKTWSLENTFNQY